MLSVTSLTRHVRLFSTCACIVYIILLTEAVCSLQLHVNSIKLLLMQTKHHNDAAERSNTLFNGVIVHLKLNVLLFL